MGIAFLTAGYMLGFASGHPESPGMSVTLERRDPGLRVD